MQILSTLVFISALVAGLVDATPTKTFQHVARHGDDNKTATKTTSCKGGEFFWEKRGCCLSHGGPKATPTPPSGIDCPFGWYFHFSQGCCVPRHKPTAPATPTCAKNGWSWMPNIQCCSKGTPPKSPPSLPSTKPKSKKDDGKNDHDYKGWHDKKSVDKIKRNFEHWDSSFCPTGLTACPVISDGVITGDSECIDPTSDLTSCGGCASLGQGIDCSTIPGSSCLGGFCVVDA